jgi:hypothetical protein
MEAKIILKSRYGIPFPLPTEEKKLRAAVKYLRVREKALKMAHRVKTIETGKIGKEVLASILFYGGEHDDVFHILTQDYTYASSRSPGMGGLAHEDAILHTMYVEHQRATSDCFTPPKLEEEIDQKLRAAGRETSRVEREAIYNLSMRKPSDPFTASELEGYVKSTPPTFEKECALSITVPEKVLANTEPQVMSPGELDGFLFLIKRGPKILSGLVNLETYGFGPAFVTLRLSEYLGNVAVRHGNVTTHKKHLDYRKLNFAAMVFIREKRAEIEKFYAERRKKNPNCPIDDMIYHTLRLMVLD